MAIKQNPNEPAITTLSNLTIGVIVAVVILGIVGVASIIILNKSHTATEVRAAKAVSDKAIVALQHRDGSAARKLGTKDFKSGYTVEQLTKQFKAIEVATSEAPSLEQHNITTADG